ncbi:DUF2877 domain-containing protein [Bacillus rubiinfantis]|uniref:DUF2877 domain-containing protein n=1 Tax=Bacillus rubiinfantis TaxID=1499680 RepID=UPI001651C8EE|nr:DUF2877 domain-containing protein [Bacillus rubiinfantis]
MEIGYGVKSNFLPHILCKKTLGKVHSVFQSSFNIVIQNNLVHFGSLGIPLSAFGINIPKSDLELLLNTIQPGNSIQLNDTIIKIDTMNHRFIIKLDMLTEVDLRLNRLKYNVENIKNSEIVKLMNEIDLIRDSGVVQSSKETSLINEIIHARPGNKRLSKACIEHFFGRGIGLTPSGDDFISGLIMVETSFSSHSYWQDELREFLSSHANSTTDVSCNYFYSLLNGYVSENFKDLLSNLAESVEKAKAKRLVNNILSYGHTSGIDTLLGIQVALKQLTHCV